MTLATATRPARGVLAMPLRSYQAEAARAVLESVANRRGLTFTVEIARQGGKNELSARLELLLLTTHLDQDVTSIKAAPTLRPQGLISLRRLWSRLQDAGYGAIAAREEGHIVRLGRARQVFLSAEPASNVVGHTADLLLEIDEAQDVDIEKFDKELRPMAASRGATTVLYGTAWDDGSLLERTKQANLEAERRDGIRRHFEFDYRVVGGSNSAYARYVAAERERLGADHPLFLSQYCLETLPGAGRLCGPDQLSLLRGSHAHLDGARPGEVYVAGLDPAGEAIDGVRGGHDSTVLTIARLLPAGEVGFEPALEVVRQYAWQGESHVALQGAIVSLLRETWGIRRVAVDATGVGEPLAAHLTRALGPGAVETVKLSAERKSRLGYDLLAAVNGGRLRLPANDGSREDGECWRQAGLCRVSYRANRTMGFFVEARDGHDDFVMSLALAVAAAAGSSPRRARGRRRDRDDGGEPW
jgi:hypothetical protein